MAQCENVFAALWLPIHLMDGLTAAGCADRTDTTSMASLVSRFEDDATPQTRMRNRNDFFDENEITCCIGRDIRILKTRGMQEITTSLSLSLTRGLERDYRET